MKILRQPPTDAKQPPEIQCILQNEPGEIVRPKHED